MDTHSPSGDRSKVARSAPPSRDVTFTGFRASKFLFPDQIAAWAAAADGAGVAPALAHLVAPRIRRGELRILDVPGLPADAGRHITVLPAERRSLATDAFLHLVRAPTAARIMREPGACVAPSRFRPPVYVTLWS